MMRKRAILVLGVLWGLVSATVPLCAAPVPDTGVTKCYNEDGNEITCPNPGEAFYGQDGNYTINPQSYTKLDASGSDLPVTATSWVMVRDNVTGIIWEVKTDDGSIHDKDNTYALYDPSDVDDFLDALCGGAASDRAARDHRPRPLCRPGGLDRRAR